MSTLPDPRSRSMTPASETGQSSPLHHPDLNDEVAALSTKLVNAINHQTYLDDTLSATRHELQASQNRIKDLEAKNEAQRQMMTGDVWVRRSTLDSEKKAMQAEKKAMQAKLADETTRRVTVEMDKKKIELELESLTADLFQEANQMVVHAKEEAKADHDAVEHKNEQLRAQLADSESLLKSQQEQLAELKQVMENMVMERDDMTNGTAPSSPGAARFEVRDDDRIGDGPPTPSANETLSPSHPTAFQHLIKPVLRNDLASYDDFVALAHMSHKTAGSRVSSGSMGGLASVSLGLGGSTSSARHSNGSTTSLNMSGAAHQGSPQSPKTPAANSSPNTMTPPGGANSINLKDTRFFKRAQVEDIEPTLRLDTAPGLSWLARRSVINAMAEGFLVVEPVPAFLHYAPVLRPHYYPCSLCGESRKAEPHLRDHRFRTSEADSAQRYPLCRYCLGRVRSTCDFLGFLRMVKDGHFRVDGSDHEKAAWEESVRLREQMFWSRIGGGVVPASQLHDGAKSRRTSHDRNGNVEEQTQEAPPPPPPAKEEAAEEDGAAQDDEQFESAPETETETESEIKTPQTPPEQTDRTRESTHSTGAKSPSVEDGQHGRSLSISIPSSTP